MIRKNKENHCPKGCLLSQLDELGYCKHLAGFTNDGKIMEPLVKVDRTTRIKDGRHGFCAGEMVVDGALAQPIRKGDVLVNPERQVPHEGVIVTTKAWVSARVYRDVEPTDEELEQATRPELAAV